MGRGRAKAKQTKVARDLKYRTQETDFSELARELHGSETSAPPVPPSPDRGEAPTEVGAQHADGFVDRGDVPDEHDKWADYPVPSREASRPTSSQATAQPSRRD